jgi:hypothetical protein
MGTLAEWCDDDPQLLEQAFADVRRDTRKATASAQAVIAQNDRDALELLELVGRASQREQSATKRLGGPQAWLSD